MRLMALVGGMTFLLGVAVGTTLEQYRSGVGVQQQWQRLFDLPIGEFSYITVPPTIVQKTGPRVLAYRPLPTSDQAKIVQLFGPTPVPAPAPAPTPESTTTTTVPPKEAP